MSSIYVLKEGQKTGPFTTGELEGNVEAGVFSREDLFWAEGMDDWQPLSSVIEEVTADSIEATDSTEAAGGLEEPIDVVHEGADTVVTTQAVHLPCGEEIRLREITKVAVQYEAVHRFRPVAGCIILGVAIICLALLELPRSTLTHWVMWGAGLLVLAFFWLRFLLTALRIPATLVIVDLQDGDERIIRTKAAAAEELCSAINLARSEVLAE